MIARRFIPPALFAGLASAALAMPACVGTETVAWEVELCGNGANDPDEECDDGNTLDGDGCSSTCQIEEPVELICDDALDNDNDGLIDCSDPDCVLFEPFCQGFPEIDCWDGIDNDLDGLIDCDDPDCPRDPNSCFTCGDGITDPGEQCDDGNDLPGDGCSEFCALEEDCQNGIDDDFNGLVDCEDPFCVFIDPALCPAVCGNGFWEPGEECDDGNNEGGDGCSANCDVEEDCQNGIDDNGDGLLDCADFWCEGFPCAGGAGVCMGGQCM